MENNTVKKSSPVFQVNFGGLVNLIAVIFLLIGLYASIRTIINIKFFEKYPLNGVLTINFGYPPYYQKEEDCLYPQTYFDEKGNMRKPTELEKQNEKINQQRCLDSVKNSRETAKMNDINMSMFFVFLGAGILITKKLFFKHE